MFLTLYRRNYLALQLDPPVFLYYFIGPRFHLNEWERYYTWRFLPQALPIAFDLPKYFLRFRFLIIYRNAGTHLLVTCIFSHHRRTLNNMCRVLENSANLIDSNPARFVD